MSKSFYDKLINVLNKNEQFVDENNELIINEVIDSALKGDKKLIQLLVKDRKIKETFFSSIDEYLFFDLNKFREYIDEKNFFNDSYTKFANKIELNIDNKSLTERSEVSLVWPYKDCILEGGMTKGDKGRNEVFFNETLAKDEIDRLLEQKILVNFKKYDSSGKNENFELKNTDNLIIKGNNLIALHSIKKWIKNNGGVKLIYIDPPYNTGSDEFKYNDSFNHSTWLTFMKDRLNIAKKLLSDDGFIFIQTDDNEQAYLKVLLDEIFGRENYLNTIIIKAKSSSGASGGGEDKRLKKNVEFITVYANTLAEISIQNKVILLKNILKKEKIMEKALHTTKFL